MDVWAGLTEADWASIGKKQNKKHGRVSSQHHFLKVIKVIEGGGVNVVVVVFSS